MPFGLPGVDTTLPVLLNGAADGRLSYERVAELYAEKPAEVYGLHPRKGSLLPGADADLVLVDPEATYELRNEDIRSRAGWSPLAGRTLKGRAVRTLLRGQHRRGGRRARRRSPWSLRPPEGAPTHDALNQLSARALRQGYLRREFSPVEVLEAVAARLERDAPLQRVHHAAASTPRWRRRKRAEKLYLSGETDAQPLLGIPIAVKDNYDMRQVRTTYGSSIFADHLPTESAECVRRAEAAGAIVIGKTNLHEFAWGITGENPHFGPCRNPWDDTRIAGGSSSGSAAAVALMVTPLALGSDTAGSIRIPASLCGIVGFKPTYDRWPRAGLFPLAPSLDHVGLMAREPRDLAILAGALDDTHRAVDVADATRNRGSRRPSCAACASASCRPRRYDQLDDDVASVVRPRSTSWSLWAPTSSSSTRRSSRTSCGSSRRSSRPRRSSCITRETSSRRAAPSTAPT